MRHYSYPSGNWSVELTVQEAREMVGRLGALHSSDARFGKVQARDGDVMITMTTRLSADAVREYLRAAWPDRLSSGLDGAEMLAARQESDAAGAGLLTLTFRGNAAPEPPLDGPVRDEEPLWKRALAQLATLPNDSPGPKCPELALVLGCDVSYLRGELDGLNRRGLVSRTRRQEGTAWRWPITNRGRGQVR